MSRTANQIAEDANAAAFIAGMQETKPTFRVTRHEFLALMMQSFEWRNMLGMERRFDEPQPRTICGLPLEITP